MGDLLNRTHKIRETMGMVALLHAGDELTAADMRNAITIIERELLALEIGNASRLHFGRADDLPILTLGEVVARAKARADGPAKARARRPQLTLIEGDRA